MQGVTEFSEQVRRLSAGSRFPVNRRKIKHSTAVRDIRIVYTIIEDFTRIGKHRLSHHLW